MLGEWQMNQPDSSVTSAEVPGTGGARVPMVGGKPYYGPMLPGQEQQAGPRITVATAEDGTKFYMQDGKVISPASGIGPDGRPLQKGADKADEETIFRIDEMGEVKFQKVTRTKNGVLHPSLKQAGWSRYEDDNGDGVPDAMQTGGKAEESKDLPDSAMKKWEAFKASRMPAPAQSQTNSQADAWKGMAGR